MVQLLLKEVAWDQDALQRALQETATTQHVHVMQLLVQWGASINGRGNSNGFCFRGPLGYAIREGPCDTIQWLLEQGSATSDLALVTAIRSPSKPSAMLPTCKLLLQHGAQDPQGHALFEAARCGYGEVVQLLLKPGSDAPQTPDEQVFRWEVALCGAASMGRVEVVKTLLEAQPAIVQDTITTATGSTPPSSTPPPSPAATEVIQLTGQPAAIAIQGSHADTLNKAVAAAQLGKGYRRPDHPRCRWPAYKDDRFGNLGWLHELMEEGCGECKAACSTAVMNMLVAAMTVWQAAWLLT
jgi:hypothetical protein